MPRLFVAIELDDGTRALATAVAAELRDGLGHRVRLGFTSAQRLHVTLAFLGEVEESRLDGVNEVVANVARDHAALAVEVGGAGAFPRSECARVLWLAFGQQSSALRSLAVDLQMRLRAAGQDIDDRQWSGHITLARCRESVGVDASEALARLTDRRVDCPVEALVVMESRRAPGGASYLPRFRAALGAGHPH
jgi:RNA 2',3'-cyclic 3'-phosphodiesterase